MLSPHLHSAEITSSWTEWRFCPVSVTGARWTHTLIAPVYLCNPSCHTFWKFRKTGKFSRSTLHHRELRGKLRDCNISQNRSSGNPACAGASTLYHFRHLRVYSWRCPIEPMGGGESAPTPPKPSKQRSAARAAEAKSYRHTLCVRSGPGVAIWPGPAERGLQNWLVSLTALRVYLFWCRLAKSKNLWLNPQRDVVCKKNKQGKNCFQCLPLFK